MNNSKKEYSTIFFSSAHEWRSWLEQNHDQIDGVWIKMYKKDADISSPTRSELLDEALCFGWIDGQAKSIDDKAYLQKYTPRRKKSLWSKINIGHIERLTKAGKMHPSGLKEVETAKNDGRWDAAYNPPSTMPVPQEFLDILSKNKKAEDFFNQLNKTNKFAISWRIETAKKEETKLRRIEKIITMLENDEKFH
jgi:uncharacterized protein YdeI (YjbR/CyaY-like superfamily)